MTALSQSLGRSFKRRDVLIIVVAIIGVAFYVITTHVMAGGAGFPLDDSWIHQTYGRNLAQTGQWEYVPGIRSAGSTSPLYTVLLAIGYFLRIPFYVWTYTLGALALALCGVVGARLAERLYPQVRNVGLLTGLALVMAWHLLWAAGSGMETMLFGTLTLVLIAVGWHQVDSGDPRANFINGGMFGIIGALLVATRPEGVILIGLLVVARVVAVPLKRPSMIWVIGALIGGAVGIAPYALLNLSINGTILPNTAAAKQAENAPLLLQPFHVNLWAMVQPLTAGGQFLLAPGVVWGVVKLFRQVPRRQLLVYVLPLLWFVALILLYTLRLPAYYQHGRYVIPVLPAFIVIGVGGMLDLFYRARRGANFLLRISVQGIAFAALVLFVWFWLQGALIFANDVQLINSDMVVAARWLADNIPADQLLAVHDIGAVGYFAPRPMLDLAGLISPEVIPIILDREALMTLMEARGARYLFVLPNQNPAVPNDPRLCERFNAHGLMGGMAIYELKWNGQC